MGSSQPRVEKARPTKSIVRFSSPMCRNREIAPSNLWAQVSAPTRASKFRFQQRIPRTTMPQIPCRPEALAWPFFVGKGCGRHFTSSKISNGLLGKEKKRSTAYLQYCTYLRKKLLIWAGRSIFQNTGLETEWIIGLQIWRPILVIPAPPPPFQTQMWGVLRGSLFVPPSIPSFTTNPLLNH
jgi:hypothetical protein